MNRQATQSNEQVMVNTSKFKLRDLEIKLKRINLDGSDSVLVTKELLDKLSTPGASGYDSDETVLYFPITEELPKKPKVVLMNKGKELIKPAKHLIRTHPSHGVFKISVHSVKCR